MAPVLSSWLVSSIIALFESGMRADTCKDSDHEAITEEQLQSAVGGYEKLILHSLGKKVAGNEQNFKESL